MTEYGPTFKASMVKKLMVPGGPTASALSARTGISEPTLSRWLRDAKDALKYRPGYPKTPLAYLAYLAYLAAARAWVDGFVG